MSKAKFPTYLKPTPEFMQRLAAVQDPRIVVTELQFVQWTHKRFGAEWRHGEVGRTVTAEMHLGGAEPSLQAIEERVLKFLKTDETV